MRQIILTLGLIFGVQTLWAAESPCSNEACVARKNEAMAAVFNFLFNEERCVSTDKWIQSIVKTGDSTFTAVCGSTAKTVSLNLRVSPQSAGDGSEGDFFVEILN